MIIKTKEEALILIASINILYTSNSDKKYKWSINKEGVKVLMFHFTAMDLKERIKKDFNEDYTVRTIGYTVRKFSYKQKKTTTSISYKSKPVNAQGYHFTEKVVKMICNTYYIEYLNNDVVEDFRVNKGIIHDLFRD